MFKHLQQLNTSLQATDRRVGVATFRVLLNANYALLLVLVIIPTLSGVVLIA